MIQIKQADRFWAIDAKVMLRGSAPLRPAPQARPVQARRVVEKASTAEKATMPSATQV